VKTCEFLSGFVNSKILWAFICGWGWRIDFWKGGG